MEYYVISTISFCVYMKLVPKDIVIRRVKYFNSDRMCVIISFRRWFGANVWIKFSWGFDKGLVFILDYFCSRMFIFSFWIPACCSCFSVFLLLCFLFLRFCVSCFSVFWFYVFVFHFFAFLFLHFFVFLAFLFCFCFSCFSLCFCASLLLCFSCFSLFCFSAFFYCFSVSFLYCLCVFLSCLYAKWNPRETPDETQIHPKEILIRNPKWNPKEIVNETLKKPTLHLKYQYVANTMLN